MASSLPVKLSNRLNISTGDSGGLYHVIIRKGLDRGLFTPMHMFSRFGIFKSDR